MQQFASFFAVVPDPRAANARHEFMDILFIAIAAVLCGARNCSEMELFGIAKEALLRRILKLPYGIPSHDTFSAVFRALDPTSFAQAFGRFTATFAQALGANEVVAIDGKAMRGAFEKGKRTAPRMLVTAWGARTRLTLAGMPVQEGNEAKAAIKLLSLIDIRGATVTADALHCSREMAGAVIARAGDFVFTLKGNQGPLHTEAQALLEVTAPTAPSAETRDVAHGRAELRRAVVVVTPSLAETHSFPGLAAIGRIESVREVDGEREETTTRLFALSRVLAPTELLAIVREHWGIETSLHWVLDVVLDEDRQRTRKDHGPDNLALLRRFALNVLRQDKSKGSLTGKMKRAGWDDAFLLNLLAQMR